MGGTGGDGILGFEPAAVARLSLAGLVAQRLFMLGVHAVAAFVLGGKEAVGHAHVLVTKVCQKGHLLLFARRALLAAHREILALPGSLGVIIAHL